MDAIYFSEEHGGIDAEELKRLSIPPEGLIDFSVNSNPFGPAPAVIEAVRSADISSYPDRRNSALREALAIANRVSPRQVLVGNGTAELIWLAAQALLRPGDQVAILGPTFGEYRRAVQAMGAQVEEVRAQPPDFRPPFQQLLAFIETGRPRLVFVCNPNNPTGVKLDPGALEQLIAACGEETFLVLDEAYRAFVQGEFFGEPPSASCLVLRSMTKDFALAGLRLGYALGSPPLMAQLARFQPAWSVNALAQAAGLVAIRELAYYRGTLQKLMGLKKRFFAQIRESGFDMSPSDVHFGVIAVGRPAKEVRRQLLQSSIQVRDCASFGLPEHIRISTRGEADNARLLEALRILFR